MKLSVITVNLNNKDGLARTIRSVVGQSAKDYEYIIMDGGSIDGSVDIIRENESKIAYWESCQDKGIYNAMNKGIVRAAGDFCLFLNSGDTLVSDNAIENVLAALNDKSDIFYAFPMMVNGKGIVSRLEYDDSIDVNYFLLRTVNHQNTIIRRVLLVEMGMYREDFKIAADWLFFLKAAYLGKRKFSWIDVPIALYTSGGISSTPLGHEISKKEREIGIKEVFGDMSASILDYIEYKNSVYGSIVAHNGYTRMLWFILMAYRFLARRIPILNTENKIQY